MDFAPVLKSIKDARLGARRYEREGHGKFRDLVTLCTDGRTLFERYCYGEAASLVCTMWGRITPGDGSIAWEYESCAYSGKTEAPVQLTGIGEGGRLEMDIKRLGWLPEKDLKRAPGKGFLGGVFRKK